MKRGLGRIGLTRESFIEQLYQAWGVDEDDAEHMNFILLELQRDSVFAVYTTIFKHGYELEDGYKDLFWMSTFERIRLEGDSEGTLPMLWKQLGVLLG